MITRRIFNNILAVSPFIVEKILKLSKSIKKYNGFIFHKKTRVLEFIPGPIVKTERLQKIEEGIVKFDLDKIYKEFEYKQTKTNIVNYGKNRFSAFRTLRK